MPRKTYSFDSNSEGWRVFDNNTDNLVGGAMYNSFFNAAMLPDNETGTSPWFATPADFSGDNSVLIGGTASFSYRNADAQSFADHPISSIDVMLVSNDGTKLFASIPISPTTGTVLQTVSFGLDAVTFGTSTATFEQVMGDLAFFGINGDARAGIENTLIDNVAFDAPADGVVDGEATGDLMGVGYNDETGAEDGGGDLITEGADSIRGEGGADTIDGAGGDDTIDGGVGDDSIEGGFGRDLIRGQAGNDTLSGGEQSDTLEGGDDNDLISGGYSTDMMDGGAGNDTVSYHDAFGGTEYVRLDLEAGTGELRADDGTLKDTETVTNFENAVGGAGHDEIFGTSDANRLEGADGDDLIEGRGGNDTIIGGQGADTLAGGTGDDALSGGDGADRFVLEDGFGADTIVGGEGGTDSDILDLSALSAAATVRVTSDEAGTASFGGDTLSFSEIEEFIGTFRGDVFTADTTSAPISIDAGGGADLISATQGADTIFGGDGNDRIEGEGGADNLHGGAGDDLILGYDGNATFSGSTAVSTDDGSEDTLTGGGGNDTLHGGAGNDSLAGGADDDSLDGGAGQDELGGGSGNDLLIGGAGSDTLTGGTGNDDFVLADGSGSDVVTDFDLADDDGNGFTNDQLDVSDLTNADGNPVDAWDVVVSDDGSGNAVLSFPNGESVTLLGLTPAQVSGAGQLHSMGIPCFARGTLIRTPRGQVPVEELRAGDRVSTLAHGPQPVLWAGRRTLDRAALEANPDYRPIVIPAGLLGNHSPLLVSPLHCLLLGPAQGLPGHAFVRARHLAEAKGPVRTAHGKRHVEYHHILCPHHQVLFSNGAPSESFYPGFEALRTLSQQDRAALFQRVRALEHHPVAQAYGPRAFPVLRRSEALKAIAAFLDRDAWRSRPRTQAQ